MKEEKDRSGHREESAKGSPEFSPKRSLVRRGVPEAGPRGGKLARKRAIAMEDIRVHQAGIHLPPIQRAMRAPGRVNSRKGKRGGINRKSR